MILIRIDDPGDFEWIKNPQNYPTWFKMVQGDPRSTMIHDRPISLRGKSQGSRDISRVKGNLKGKGKSQGSREISRVEGNLKGKGKHGEKSRGRRGWISQSLPSLGGARTFSHHYQGRLSLFFNGYFNKNQWKPMKTMKNNENLLQVIKNCPVYQIFHTSS